MRYEGYDICQLAVTLFPKVHQFGETSHLAKSLNNIHVRVVMQDEDSLAS
jgi:hypothetical protein